MIVANTASDFAVVCGGIALLLGAITAMANGFAGSLALWRSSKTLVQAGQTIQRVETKVDSVHKEVTTLNGKTIAVLADEGETRRVDAIPPKERTDAEQEHIDIVPPTEKPTEGE